VPSGAIISSEISAKLGVQAQTVGTEASKPSSLKVGVNVNLQRQIQNLRKKNGVLKKEIAKVSRDWEAQSKQAERIGDELGQKAQEQDKLMVQIRELATERDDLPANGEKARRKMIEKQISMAEKRKGMLDEEVEALLEKDEQLSTEVPQLAAELAGLKEELDKLASELDALTAEAAKTRVFPP
jgi:chromosome segregation ATPase